MNNDKVKQLRTEAETWKTLADMHRHTIYELRKELEKTRKELNETIDAYNELYDKVGRYDVLYD